MVRYTDYTLGTSNSQRRDGNRRDYLQDERDDFRNDGDDNLNDNNGGGTTTILKKGILLNIKCNIQGAGVKFNGSFIGSVPKELRISKADLIEKGDRIIEIGKTGYTSNEKYVVSLINGGGLILKNNIYDGGFSGLNQTRIIIKYYVNNIEQSFPEIKTGFAQTITFNLTKGSDGNVPRTRKLAINLSGVRGGNPIVLRKNGYRGTDVFPQLGETEYQDTTNTEYTLESADLSLYRIIKITYNDSIYKQVPLTANDNESLTMSFKLRTNYSIIVEVESVSKYVPPIRPVIKLLKTDARTYNINKAIGVPIVFEKNSTVKAITIIVGDDILEFDNLGEGDIAGVTIPHNVFDNIGKYNIKLFPFSLNDYEEELEPPPSPIKQIPVKPKPKPIFAANESIIIPEFKIDINPYMNNNGNNNYLSNNISSNGYNFNFSGLNNFIGIGNNSSILNNYK